MNTNQRISAETGICTSVEFGGKNPRLWNCLVVSGEDSGKEIAIGARPVVIGADESCDLVLTDPAVSRRHVEVRAAKEGISIRDLGSTNGTYYQASRVTEVMLAEDFVVTLGTTRIRVFSKPLPTVTPSNRTRFGGLIGRSLAMREVFAVLELASPSNATVVIEGESGTGKELVAQAIHDHSPRASSPLVTFDCSAIAENLLESHLFGHVEGAFTGAVGQRNGAFIEAHGGTLFLDEIGELPLASQAKLLRVLEDQTVQPLGSDKRLAVDVRVVAATNRDLANMVEQKQFRFDLFHRLSVVFIHTPPLRAHTEDIPDIVRFFLEGRGVDPGPIEGENLRRLITHPWPGNVRELRNVIERAWVLAGSRGKRFTDLRFDFAQHRSTESTPMIDFSIPFKEAKERWVSLFEQRYIEGVYAANDFNISRAAQQSGINRNHFTKLLIKYDIKKQ